jgi:glutamine synthetase
MAIAPERTATGASDVLAQVEELGVEFIRFWFTDIFGRLKSFAVGREELPGALDEGMGFDGSSITGFNRIEESDMVAMPDPTTFRILPWRTGESHSVGRLFCDVLKPGGEPYEGDPRFQMRRVLGRANEMGFDHYYLGPELEFFLFRSDEGPEVLDKGGYFDLTTLDVASASDATSCSRCGTSASRWSTPITRWAPHSTRSTCASRTVSRWPTTR